MRFLTALGLFVALSGLIVVVLRPVYRVPKAVDVQDVEATATMEQHRSIPTRLGIAAIGAGAVALALSRRRRA